MAAIDWIRYSGASITVSLNPLYWKVLPWLRRQTDLEWPAGPNEHTWAGGWLFLTLRLWIDDGQW